MSIAVNCIITDLLISSNINYIKENLTSSRMHFKIIIFYYQRLLLNFKNSKVSLELPQYSRDLVIK